MGAEGTSETRREREVFRYYQPPPSHRLERVASSSSLSPSSSPPRSSNDTSLTAFAQLAALRLNAQRGLISLAGREYQYVIAEATRTLSLRSDMVYGKADALWKGETTLPRTDGVLSAAIDSFTAVGSGKRDHLLVADMSADDRFCHMESVAGPPSIKFYAAVPLLSRKGLVLGGLYVLDNKPRRRLSDAEIVFMKDLSLTIVAHLEASRVRQQHQRAERMIQGLGLYVEGKSSLRDWWLKTGYQTNELEVTEKARHGETLLQQADQEFGVQDAPDAFPGAAITGGRPEFGHESYSDATSSAAVSEALDVTVAGQPRVSGSTPTPNTSILSHDPAREGSTTTRNPSRELGGEPVEAHLQEPALAYDLRLSFSRASNLIRESIAVEGALFLDAGIGKFGEGSKKANLAFTGPSARDNQSTVQLTSSSDETRQSAISTEAYPQKTCSILGYSTSTRSSLNLHEPSLLHSSVSESFLRKLLRRYPHGKVFNFDEEGSLSSSEDDAQVTTLADGRETLQEESQHSSERVSHHNLRRRRRMTKQDEGQGILTFLPGARSVAFFPLWDFQKERWFAGSMVWTRSPTRVLDAEEDLTYLASFGNSIMAEVSRIDALMSSQVKTSFMSSISHELRSPLHGVLASVDFLQDSPLNSFQQEMVNIVGSCGRTLLDTINHVLDFSRLRNAGTERAKEVKKPMRRGMRQPASTFSENALPLEAVNLRVLTEEVLEGIYTGSGCETDPLSDISGKWASPSKSHPSMSSTPPLVILNVECRSSWGFVVDPGAWRRLVMNIFGNALKYTDSGFVRISLGSQNEESPSTGAPSTMVTLTVADSGKGISREFLKNHLYTPFVQEDSLAVGSGLGLSIVRHIVVELGGSITIESEQASGTDVKISVPLGPAKITPLSHGAPDDVLQIRDQTRGLQACLLGFDVFPQLADEPTGILSAETRGMFHFKDSLTALLQDWFNMKVGAESILDPSTAAVSFIMESMADEFLAASPSDGERSDSFNPKPILVVVCARGYKSYPTIAHRDFEIICVQQPIGPKKLGSILARYLASSRGDRKASSAGPGPAPRNTTADRPLSLDTSLKSLPQRPGMFHRQSTYHGSRIRPGIASSLDSQAVSGSTITASLIRPEDSNAPKATTSPGTIKLTSSRYVLLVEDNAINLRLLIAWMQKLGVDFTTAENGLIAVHEYQVTTRPFDLVLMDISMPVMDGLEASRRIRAMESESNSARTPIVAISAAASPSTRQDAFSAGIDQFMTKPVSAKLLSELFSKYLLLG